jgi:hypothetical protein
VGLTDIEKSILAKNTFSRPKQYLIYVIIFAPPRIPLDTLPYLNFLR